MDTDLIDRAVGAAPVYRVGLRFDGVPVLSHHNGPVEADTVVWFADGLRSEETLTALDAEDMTDVSWLADPVEWTEPKVAAAAPPEEREGYQPLDLFGGGDEEDPVDGPPMRQPEAPEADAEAPLDDEEQVEQLTEAELDELGEAVDLAEERIGELEGLVASVVLAQVQDDIFADDPKAASATPLAVTAADRVRVRDGFSTLGPLIAAVASLGKADALPDDMVERVERVVERLDALEETVGKMMLDDVSDEQLPEAPEGSGTFVDETLDDEEGEEAPADAESPEDSDEEEGDDEGEMEDVSKYPRKKKKKAKKAPPFKSAKAAATGLPLTVDAREKAADKGYALPDGKLPIRTLVELRSAIKLRNNVKGHSADAVKAHIVKRARALDATNLLPEDWR